MASAPSTPGDTPGLGLGAARPEVAAHTGGRQHVLQELLVQFLPGTDPAGRSAAVAAVGGRGEEEHLRPGGGEHPAGEAALLRVALGRGVDLDQAIAALGRRADVAFVEPNWLVSAGQVSDDSYFVDGSLWGMGGSSTPGFGSRASDAWAAGAVGAARVAVGVVDSGIDHRHPDLHLNVGINQGEIPASIRGALKDVDLDGVITFRDLNGRENAGSVRDLNGNGRVDAGDLLADRRWADGKDGDGNRYKDDLFGWDFANNDNDPFDDNGHGTHVSGTLGGVGGNGAGVAGVAWAVEVFALKFLDAGSAGTVFNAIKAIDYFTGLSKASANAGLDFVATNNSWTGGGFSQGLLDAIDRGAGAGLLFVAAAGNGGADGVGDDNDAVASYPSGYDTSYNGGIDAVVSVAAIDGAGALAGFSNRGELSVDLGAPGVSVWSTLPGGGYGPKNGTSMAAPHVTGALALHAASHPSASAAELRAALLGSAEPTPSLAGLTATGGRLDVGDLLLLG